MLPRIVPYDEDQWGPFQTQYLDAYVVNRSSNPQGTQSQPTSIPLTDDNGFKPMSKGEALYADNCAQCHGLDAKGCL